MDSDVSRQGSFLDFHYCASDDAGRTWIIFREAPAIAESALARTPLFNFQALVNMKQCPLREAVPSQLVLAKNLDTA